MLACMTLSSSLMYVCKMYYNVLSSLFGVYCTQNTV